MSNRPSWMLAGAATVALALLVQAALWAGRHAASQARPSASTQVTLSTAAPRAPTRTAAATLAPDIFVLRPPAGDTSGSLSGPSSEAALSAAKRWAVAFATSDPTWRQLVTPSLAVQLAGQSPALDTAQLQWAALAAVTATAARVDIYLTASAAGVAVALSYDCELLHDKSGWRVVGILR